MSEIYGPCFSSVQKKDVKKPKQLLKMILEDIKKAYLADMINGDISEFNILYDGERPWIIDWPQFVPLTHVNAKEMLSRDIENPISFFSKKFGVKLTLENAISFVTGQTDLLKIN